MAPASRHAHLLAGLGLALAALAAYCNSLQVPLVFDDLLAIRDNVTIRHLGSALSPPPGALPVSGRPVVNLSFALNYAVGGLSVWSYHAVNLIIHVLAGLTLFGILRRTLPTLVAFAVALLWILHPLQTESVTYLSQRAESLMGLFYLLTLYGFIRGAEEPDSRSGGWYGLSCLACLFGMLTKEVMVSAPLMALLYDRTFRSGSFREAWRRHRKVYLGLAATWILLAVSVASAGPTRGGTSGFAIATPWAYWLTQFEAVVRYLQLSFWPSPLILYYESFWAKDLEQVLPYALVVVPLAAATLWALWRGAEGPSSPPCRGIAQRSRTTGLRRGECRAGARAFGFLGAWFFAILAPTSLVPNSIQMIAEHRMYLPLAAVITAAVGGMYSLLGQRAALGLCAIAAVGFGITTARRNEVYQSDLTLWADTVAKQPGNALAHNNLGKALYERGAITEAVAQYQDAIRLRPGPESIYAYINLGDALGLANRLPAAIATYREAGRLQPDWPGIHDKLADALSHAGRGPEAISEYERALQLNPANPAAESGLGTAFFLAGHIDLAVAHFNAALRLNPAYAEVYNNLGTALATENRLPDAIAAYERALRLKPNYPEAQENLRRAQAAEGNSGRP
jgi:tetratricopeptide (TPR) repeat protein